MPFYTLFNIRLYKARLPRATHTGKVRRVSVELFALHLFRELSRKLFYACLPPFCSIVHDVVFIVQ